MQPTTVPRPKVSVIDNSDSWIECVMTAVWNLLDQEREGTALITTPAGRACEVSVRFTTGGSA